jgi:hypothetical protein
MNQKPGAYQFSDYIKTLSPPWVLRYFLSESDASRKIVSSNVIENAISDYIQPQNLQKCFDNLDESEKLRCAAIYLTGDAGLLCDREDPLEDPLVQSFLVYAAYDIEGITHLFGFDEFEESLSFKMIEVILRNGVVVSSLNLTPQWKYRPLNDVVVVSSLVAQSEVKKGKNGKFARTTQLKLKKLIDLSSDSKSDSTEFLTRLIVDFCVSKGLVREDEIDFYFNSGVMQQWMKRDWESRLSECKEYAINSYGAWRLGFLDKLFDAADSCWISYRIFPEKDREDIFNAIRALKFAGVIEYYIQDEMVLITKAESFASLTNMSSNALVQADFTAVIPQEAGPDEIFHFAQIGELVFLDKVYKGKLEKEIVSNSLSRGVDSDQVLEWLEHHQAPSNVIETVKEWVREFFRLFVTERITLVSGEEKVSRQIESYEPLKSCLDIIPAHTVYQIKRGCEEKVKEILTGLGFDYRQPGEDQEIGPVDQMNAEDYFMKSITWKPVTEMRSEEKKQLSAMRGTKYGEELKSLDMSEIIHVIDYAVLTGRNLIIDYEGSPYLKPGVYTVLPLSCRKGMDPILDAELLRTKSRKQFYVKKIRKIGVASE